MTGKQRSSPEGSISAAFGARNRQRLIDRYFSERLSSRITASSAWEHVYRLLLWADQSNGLAHCYESDKSQPGKTWYARSLAFHDWVATKLATTPMGLAHEIDWLFLRAADDLAGAVLRKASRLKEQARNQRAPYQGREFPKPGVDPELVHIIRDVIGEHFSDQPSPEKWEILIQRIRQYLMLQNKRKNLVGEGFEDVLANVVRRTCGDTQIEVSARRLLHDIPGFNRARRGDKQNKVDLTVLRPGMRTLVTAKWSLRADREKQFPADFAEYVNAESDGKPFEYVFITNEFDPARLMRACEKLAANAPLFAHVVHINTDAILTTYGDAREESMRRVIRYIDTKRLISLEGWLELLVARD